MKHQRAMKIPPCIKCKAQPTAYAFPSGYRQIGCFDCNRYAGGNDEQQVFAAWCSDNKKAGGA